MEWYVTTTYRLHELKYNEYHYGFISMYMYSLSGCRVSVFRRRSWYILRWGNHLSAGFADKLSQLLNFIRITSLYRIFQRNLIYQKQLVSKFLDGWKPEVTIILNEARIDLKNLDKREKRWLFKMSVNDPKKIGRKFWLTYSQKKGCSTSLIRNILITYGLRAKIALKKPLLTRANQHFWKEWAINHVLKPINFWKIFIFFPTKHFLNCSKIEKIYMSLDLPKLVWRKNIHRKLQNSEEKSSWFGDSLPVMTGKVSQKVQETSFSIITFKFCKNNLLPSMKIGEIFNRIMFLPIMFSKQKFGWPKLR